VDVVTLAVGVKLMLLRRCDCNAVVLAAVTVVNIPEPMMGGFAVDVPCLLWRSPGCCAVIRLPTAVVTVAVVGSCFKTATWL
jgi:hypothetical protein